MDNESKYTETGYGRRPMDEINGNENNQEKNAGAGELQSGNWIMTRRVFLKSTMLFAAVPFFSPLKTVMGINGYEKGAGVSILRFGLMTDSHFADIDPSGTRFYRESENKMKECIGFMNRKEVDFLVHLGDFKNGAPDRNLENLELIESIYARFNGPRYHVLGNHDLDSISKKEFQSLIHNTGIDPELTYYSFDKGGVHFVVLDANFTSDGIPYQRGNFHWTDSNLPENQLDWLEKDLAASEKPVVILTHQLLDGDEGSHYIKNAAEVRKVLERHNNVMIAFQGHQHAGQYNLINDIHYYTLKAMVEGSGEQQNSYVIVELFDNSDLTISGYRKAVGKELQTAV